MTEQTEERTAPAVPVVLAEQNTRLEQLHASYAEAKSKAKAAADDLKAITDAIKLELTQAAPEGSTRVQLRSSVGQPLELDYRETWRFDSKKFQADDPVTYVRYAKKSGAWYLNPISTPGGGEES